MQLAMNLASDNLEACSQIYRLSHEKSCDYWLIINLFHFQYSLKAFFFLRKISSYSCNFIVMSSYFDQKKNKYLNWISRSATNILLKFLWTLKFVFPINVQKEQLNCTPFDQPNYWNFRTVMIR